jgi:hypothetical protein
MAWLKIIFTLFLCILLLINWITYGPANILWISDITLLLAYFATIFQSRFLSSMAILQGLFFESMWVIALLISLIAPMDFALIKYMYDSSIPIWIRCISLFHLILPPYLVWLLYRFGYTKKALPLQIGINWIVIFLTWAVSKPSANINFVYSYQKYGWNPLIYLVGLAAAISIILCFTHLIVKKRK